MSPEPSKRGSGPGPKVFITYRREETSPHAGRLYDAMVARYGEDNVFMDVDMAPGSTSSSGSPMRWPRARC